MDNAVNWIVWLPLTVGKSHVDVDYIRSHRVGCCGIYESLPCGGMAGLHAGKRLSRGSSPLRIGSSHFFGFAQLFGWE